MSEPASPRIPPVSPPYDLATAALLQKWMPPGAEAEPLVLFRTLAVHPELMSRMRPLGSGILGHGLLAPRERELLIHRTCARAGAEYEWGVHAVAFGAAVGLTPEQLAATAAGTPADPAFTDERDRLLLRLADELHDTAGVSAPLWAELRARWPADQLLEAVVTVGWYRLLSQVINAAALPLEPWAARFPGGGAGMVDRRQSHNAIT